MLMNIIRAAFGTSVSTFGIMRNTEYQVKSVRDITPIVGKTIDGTTEIKNAIKTQSTIAIHAKGRYVKYLISHHVHRLKYIISHLQGNRLQKTPQHVRCGDICKDKAHKSSYLTC